MTISHEIQSNISLPYDVVMEILRRVRPIKSLVKLQLVCKEWRKIIRGPRFAEEYHNDSAIVDNYNRQIVRSREAPIGSRFKMICNRYGLPLLKRFDDDKYFLWNPAICRVLELPDPHHSSYGFALLCVSSNRNYILLSVYEDKGSGGDACEFITLSHGSRAWTRLMSFPENVIGGVEEKSVQLVTSTNEVHCIRSFKAGTEIYREVVTIDIGNESCTVTCVQKGSFRDWTTVRAINWNGKLGFADVVGENLHVLVLEDHKKKKWSGKRNFIPLPFVKKENYNQGSLIPLFAENGDIRFWLKDEKIFSYNMDTGLITNQTNYLQSKALPDTYCPYKQSMIHLDGMQPDTLLERLRTLFIRD